MNDYNFFTPITNLNFFTNYVSRGILLFSIIEIVFACFVIYFYRQVMEQLKIDIHYG